MAVVTDFPAEIVSLLACCFDTRSARVLVALECSKPASSSSDMSLGAGCFTKGPVGKFVGAGLAELVEAG